jgi:predicted glycoside hydrolase/deacetylase ChbG (UPF0249 family)
MFRRLTLMMTATSCALMCWTTTGHAQQARVPVQERLGYPADARLLIIHADDLGMAHSVNRATFEALEKKWVTSASILVACPWFPEVVQFARAHPDADLGIHLAVNSEWTTFKWGPLSGAEAAPSLVDEQGYLPLIETTVVEKAKPIEVDRELRLQVDRARKAGIPLSHLDSHMATLFQSPALFEVYRKLGPAYDLPLLIERTGGRGGSGSPWSNAALDEALVDQVLSLSPGVAASEWRDAYEKLLAPLAPGVYELIVHLAYDDDEMRGATADHPDWGAAWRQSDLDMVRSPEFQQFLRDQKFVLIGWKELGKARTAEAPTGARR